MAGIFYILVSAGFIWGEALIFKTGTPDMIDYFYGMVFFAGWMFSFFPGVDVFWEGIMPKDWKDSKWIGYLAGLIASVSLFLHLKQL